VLAPAVADQIAAGEVVERPASVVKELVENSLDAGATAIDIAVEDGGRASIRVSDDGCGMSSDDAVLSLERHATSKIRAAQDLVGVRSFGFRGEALAAICSVSQLELATSTSDGSGTAVSAAGGSVLSVSPIARRRGTTISVNRIFYNAPARLKFLRGSRSEWRAILDAVGAMALTRRDVRFTVSHDGKVAAQLPAAETLRDRLAALHGAAFAARLLEVEDVSGTTHVSGLVERPADVGTAARRVFLSVNGRSVRDTGIVRAAESAYRSTVPSGVRPTLYLDLVVAANQVDVNVHPAKSEVRFGDRWQVERAVEAAVRRAIGVFDAGPYLGRRDQGVRFLDPRPIGENQGVRVLDPASGDGKAPVDVEALRPGEPDDAGLFASEHAQGTDGSAAQDAAGRAAPATGEFQPSATDANASAAQDREIPPLIQLRRTYMMFEHEHGVVLIDQHSAHERVIYEQFMRVLEQGAAPAQRLLFPLTLHLSPSESDAFEESRASLERLGFEIEGFGGNTLIVRAVPMPHPRFDAERCLRETLATLSGDRDPGAHARHERLAATVACKAAIKAGESLSQGEMRALFASLRDTVLPAHDVHGRATIVQLTWDELERRFGRR
jgi:DNA mismatch repair protein MutL